MDTPSRAPRAQASVEVLVEEVLEATGDAALHAQLRRGHASGATTRCNRRYHG